MTTADGTPTPSAPPVMVPSTRRRRIPAALRSPLAIVALAIITIWVAVMILAPWISPAGPTEQSFERLTAPSAEHWFGTDQVGRDVFSRVLHGARMSIPVAALLVSASLVVGAVLGAIAGYFGRVVDEVIMRVADLVFAFPTIILAMVIAAALGPSLRNAVIAILVVSWPPYARVTRSLVLSAREAEYVVAGRLLGNGPFTSLTKDVMPNVAAPVVVLATLDIGTAILLLSGLSFLGLGAVPPTPEWGAMVSDGIQQFSSWWIAGFPGLAIMSIVLAFNMLGDVLRDSLDPHTAQTVKGRAL
ncbi:ABC transporter permease [Phytoactinopolyspora limicola]|uniref:ABC transporter permease n=1 Tax=Phytoactinopolyspora limicola TaxID=2715536 RepID=UPI001A9CB44E|nr:ABC transporter permease [Phytoactinopolyspora limicola]